MLKTICLTALALSLGACVPTTSARNLASPADPSVRVRDPAYRSVTSGIRTFEVAEPKDWLELNRQVGPKPSQQDRGHE